MEPTNVVAGTAGSGSSPPSSGLPTVKASIARRRAANAKARQQPPLAPGSDYEEVCDIGRQEAPIQFHAVRVVVAFELDGTHREVTGFFGDAGRECDWDAAALIFNAWSQVVGLQNVNDKRICLSVRLEEEVSCG